MKRIIKNNGKILCLAEEAAEFSLAFAMYMGKLGFGQKTIRRTILSLPGNLLARALIKEMYLIIGLPEHNIAEHFDAGDVHATLVASKKDGGFAKDYKKIAYALKVSKSGHLCDVTLDEKQGEEERKMTIDFKAIVGNPPYQKPNNGDSQGNDAIYDEFMDLCYELTDGKAVLITPARWMSNAGKTSKKWNQEKLDDVHLRVVEHWVKGDEIFPGTDIKGGVAITEYDKNSDIGPIGMFISNPHLRSACMKVIESEKFASIQNSITLQNNLNLELMFSELPETRDGILGKDKRLRPNAFEKLPTLFHDEKQSDNDEMILGLIKNKRYCKWVDGKYLLEHPNRGKWGVYVPKANGTGAIGEVLSSPVIGEPVIGHTQSFICFGLFDTREEAEACLKYVKSKFARAMLGTLKTTQDNPPATWANVPLQDFTENSNIDWLKTIADIDQQLYEKYGLNEEEIAFIETNVKEMK